MLRLKYLLKKDTPWLIYCYNLYSLTLVQIIYNVLFIHFPVVIFFKTRSKNAIMLTVVNSYINGYYFPFCSVLYFQLSGKKLTIAIAQMKITRKLNRYC